MNPDLFTVKKALEMQKEHIAQWEMVLNISAYRAVVAKAKAENELLNDTNCGYDVWRGQRITEFICSLSIQKYYKYEPASAPAS